MRTSIVIETDLPSEVFGISDENDDIVWADASDVAAKENKIIAKKLGCSPELVKEIASAFTFFIGELEGELGAIWKRIDKMEKG